MFRNKISYLAFAALLAAGFHFTNITKADDKNITETPAVAADAAYDGDKYVLPPLPYAYDALEPHIDAETMKLHHDKHHASYVKGANTAVEKLREIADGKADASLTTHWVRQLAFNGSGHSMHCIFWKNMTPDPKAAPEGALADAIKNSFGSYDGFVRAFKAACSGVEGSGWGVLGYDPISKKLVILGLEKHQNLTMMGITPLLVCDVWEHAYYLKHKNDRGAYIDSFMKVINWNDVEARYAKASGK